MSFSITSWSLNSFVVNCTNFYVLCPFVCCCFSIFSVHFAINLKGRFYLNNFKHTKHTHKHIFIIHWQPKWKPKPFYFLWIVFIFRTEHRLQFGSLFMTFCFDYCAVYRLIQSQCTWSQCTRRSQYKNIELTPSNKILLFGRFVVCVFFLAHSLFIF